MVTKILFAEVMNVTSEVIFEEVERFIVLYHDGSIELSGNRKKLTIKDEDNNVLGWVSCRPQNLLSSRVRIWFDDWESDPKKSEYWQNTVWRGLYPNPEKPKIMEQLVEYISREFMINDTVHTAVPEQPEPKETADQAIDNEKQVAKDVLNRLQKGIIEVVRERRRNKLPLTDEDIAKDLADRNVYSPKTGNPYTREWINRVRRELIKLGHDVDW